MPSLLASRRNFFRRLAGGTVAATVVPPARTQPTVTVGRDTNFYVSKPARVAAFGWNVAGPSQ